MADAKLNFILQARDNASGEIRAVSNSLGEMGSTASFASDAAGGLASALAAIGAGAAISSAVNAFADSEQAMNNFEAIMSTLPPSLQALKPEIAKVAEEAIYLGFSNEDASLGMAKFLKVLGYGPDAFKALTTAEGVAVMHHESLGEAVREVILGMDGMGKAFKDDGIVLDGHLTKQQNLNNIYLQALPALEHYKGSTAMVSAAMKELGNQAEQSLGEQFAGVFKPLGLAIIQFIKDSGGIMKLLNDWKPAFEVVAALLVGVVVAGFVLAAATLGTVIAAIGTFGATIALIVGLIAAGITYLVLDFQNFKNSLIAVWELIKIGFKAAADWIETNVWKPMMDWIDKITAKLTAVWNSITNITSKVGNGISGAASSVWNGAKSLVGLADGGVVTRPTLAMIGEGGESEAVIPLSKLGSMGGGGITINFNGDMYSGAEAAEMTANQIARIIKNQLNLGGIHA